MNVDELAIRLPMPGDMPAMQVVAHVYVPGTPKLPVVVYPGLFAANPGGELYPFVGVALPEEDRIRLQALFAARQFLTARCKECGLQGVPEENPFIEGSKGTLECLFSELSLLSALLGVVSSEMLMGPRTTQAQLAYFNFTSDMHNYAPWILLPQGAPSFHVMVEQGHAKLKELGGLITDYKDRVRHFRQAQQQQQPPVDSASPPERERSSA
jgi:hypothetical protein